MCILYTRLCVLRGTDTCVEYALLNRSACVVIWAIGGWVLHLVFETVVVIRQSPELVCTYAYIVQLHNLSISTYNCLPVNAYRTHTERIHMHSHIVSKNHDAESLVIKFVEKHGHGRQVLCSTASSMI